MPKFSFLVVFVLLFSVGADACTSVFVSGGGDKFLGKAYDWSHDNGQVLVNKRNVQKASPVVKAGDNSTQWSSKFGSLTFNQHGREFPLGGMNEAGLVVEIMWLDSSVYPGADSRGTVNELQWIQYQLDNFETVAEMVASADKLRVSNMYAKVHYLACDAIGSCATFEYIGGKMKVHSGSDLPVSVLTNNTYADSVTYLKKHLGFGGTEVASSNDTSLDRFVRAASLAEQYYPFKGTALDHTLDILEDVSPGTRPWHLVYDLENKKIWFRTKAFMKLKEVNMGEFDFSCAEPVVLYDMNQAGEGDVTASFVPYTQTLNLENMKKGLTGIGEHLPKGAVEKLSRYPESTKCLE